MKKSFTIAIIALLISCSKDENFSKETNNFVKTEILDFSSLEEMNAEIIKITELKKAKESAILNRLLSRNKNSERKSDYLSKDTAIAKDFTFNDLKPDLVFYHKERLNNIYELRRLSGFTSIQSIADEINSLKLLEPKKAEELYFKNFDLLEKSKYKVVSIFGGEISNVLNSKGEVKVEGKILSLDTYNKDYGIINKKKSYLSKSAELDGLVDSSTIGGNGTTAKYITNDSGILGTKFGVLIVVWEAGKLRDKKNIFWRYAYYTKFEGFVNIGKNVYISYPLTLDVGAPSYCKFKSPNLGIITVDFQDSGTVDGSDISYYSSSRSFYLNKVFIQKSMFSVVLKGVTHSISTNSFSRNYDNYIPNNNPTFD